MHQCLRCDRKYKDNDKSVLNGCDCGSKLFLFVKEDLVGFNGNGNGWEVLKKEIPKRAVPRIEKRIMKRRKSKGMNYTVKVRSGVYDVNLDALFKGRPVVMNEDGVFNIRMDSLMNYASKKLRAKEF